MKKTLALILCLLATLLIFASCGGEPEKPSEFYYERIMYPEIGEAYELIIYNGEDEHVVIPSEIDGIPVVSLGHGVFNGTSSLKTVEIPESIKVIKNSAFVNCPSLEMLVIPSTVDTLASGFAYECTSLTELTLYKFYGINSFNPSDFPALRKLTAPASMLTSSMPDTVEEINVIYEEGFVNDGAFDPSYNPNASVTIGGNGLKKLVIADGITGVRVEAPMLTELTLPSTLTTLHGLWDCAMLETVTLPNGITTLGYNHNGQGAFRGCSSLKEIVIPDGVTELYSNTFEGCTSLERVVLASSLISVCTGLFDGCNSLKSITSPINPINGFSTEELDDQEFQALYGEYIANIDSFDYAIASFGNNSESLIKYAKLPKTANSEDGIKIEITRSLGDKPISINANISIILGEGITEIPPKAFKGATLKSLTIPDSIVKIGKQAFYQFGLIGSSVLTLPNSIAEIDDSAFAYTKLEELVLPNQLTSIAKNVFDGSEISNITLPNTLSTIGNAAFRNCKNLTSITLPEGLVEIGVSTFEGSSITSIHIPSSTTTVGMYAFNTPTLTEITGGEGLTRIDGGAFNYDAIEETVYGNVRYKFLKVLGPVSTDVQWIRLKRGSIVSDNAFEGCQALTTAFIPVGTTLGNRMFYNNSSSLRVFLEGEVPTNSSDWRVIYNEGTRVLIGGYITVNGQSVRMGSVTEQVNITEDGIIYKDGAILGYVGDESEITLPASLGETNVTSVVEMALATRTDITSIKIDGIKTISPLAFAEMKNLRSVSLHGVETIDQQAFMNCTLLTDLTLGEGLGYIRAYAFYGCASLATIAMPASLYTIMPSAFYGCSTLASVSFAAGNTSWVLIAQGAGGYTEIVETLDLSDSATAASALTSDGNANYMFVNDAMLNQ